MARIDDERPVEDVVTLVGGPGRPGGLGLGRRADRPGRRARSSPHPRPGRHTRS